MVDSVIFRIHDLVYHQNLKKHIENLTEKTRTVKMMTLTNEVYDNQKAFYIRHYYRDVATGREVEAGARAHLKSSHYDCAIMWNLLQGRGFVEFNLSLPKYWFGNNVSQLIDHYQDPDFFHVRNHSFWDCQKQGWRRFVQVMNHFISTMLGGEMKDGGMVDKSLLEITRIDICFNLCLNNEEDANFYIDEIRGIRKKGMHDISSKALDYDGAVYFPSKNVTLKIYQKGKEFKKNSYRKVKKRYGEREANILQKMANCMLRFEVEFRKGGMTDAFFKLLKNRKHPLYECLRMARSYSAHGYFSRNGVKYNKDGLNNKGQSNVYTKMTYDDAKKLQLGQKLISKEIAFYSHRPSYGSVLNMDKSDIIKQYDHSEHFSPELFSVLVERFKALCFQFRLGNMKNIEWAAEVLQKSKTQKEVDRQFHAMTGFSVTGSGLSSGKIQLLMGYLREFTWKEIEQKKVFPLRTLRRYKKWFTDQGLAEKNTSRKFNIDWTYATYFDIYRFEFDLVNKRQNFF